jgi:putative transposase
VDQGEPGTLRSIHVALSQRFDGWEWSVLAPLIPPARHGGRPREVDMRAVIGGLLYVLETGCPWRHLPKDFPPKSTVHSYFELWAAS